MQHLKPTVWYKGNDDRRARTAQRRHKQRRRLDSEHRITLARREDSTGRRWIDVLEEGKKWGGNRDDRRARTAQHRHKQRRRLYSERLIALEEGKIQRVGRELVSWEMEKMRGSRDDLRARTAQRRHKRRRQLDSEHLITTDKE